MPVDETNFEDALKLDLPRGHDRPARSIGRDRVVTSRWMAADEMDGPDWTSSSGILLGRRAGRIISWNDDRHLLTIAGSRAGKGVSLIIPNLIHYEGSAVVIDPKGENAARTARRRGKGTDGVPGLNQAVHVLDPFGESGLPTASFNPLDKLDPNDPAVVEQLGVFADALIIHPERSDRHWTESAQAVIRALVLAVLADPRFANRRNLITVRQLLALTDPSIADAQEVPGSEDLLAPDQALIRILMAQTDTPYGYICIGIAQQLASMGEKERGSILSTGRTQTQWLDSPRMAAVLQSSDLDMADLKNKRVTVYLCLPASYMALNAPWLRLIVLLALNAMERTKIKPEIPVLFVLDEFPVLRYMESIETAAGLMAGFGVKLWTIMQNLGQLKRHYKDSWETFIANSGVVTAFGVSDSETLKALSETIGHSSIMARTDSNASRDAMLQGAAPFQDQRRDVPLLAPHELRIAFGRGTQRILIGGAESNFAVARRFTYYDDAHFKSEDGKPLYDPDPNYMVTP